MPSFTLTRFLVVLGVVCLLLGGTIVLTDDDGDGVPETYTFTVNEAAGDNAPTRELSVPLPVVQDASASLERNLDSALDAPVTPQQVKGIARAERGNRVARDPLPTAGATQGFAGCVSKFVRNQSSRNGVRPTVQVLHYTVSPNRPGWSDVNAIVALFDRPSFQASSHFVIDAEGNCAYIVPIEAKSWTEAGGNSFGISYEVINSGSEPAFMGTAGYAKLKSVMRQVSARTGIPLTRGRISGCVPVVGGTVQHKDGGVCWGGHHDIEPFSVDAVIKIVGGPVYPPITARQRARCQELNRIRRAGHGKSKRARELRKGQREHHLRCVNSRPGKLVRR